MRGDEMGGEGMRGDEMGGEGMRGDETGGEGMRGKGREERKWRRGGGDQKTADGRGGEGMRRGRRVREDCSNGVNNVTQTSVRKKSHYERQSLAYQAEFRRWQRTVVDTEAGLWLSSWQHVPHRQTGGSAHQASSSSVPSGICMSKGHMTVT